MASTDDESTIITKIGCEQTCQPTLEDSSTIYQGQSIFDCGNQKINFNRQFTRPKDKINSYSTEKMVELGCNIMLKFEELGRDMENFSCFYEDSMTNIIKQQIALTNEHFKLNFGDLKSKNYHPTPNPSQCSTDSTVDSSSECSTLTKNIKSTSTQTSAGKLYNRDFLSDEAIDRQKLLNSNAQLLKELKSLNTNRSLKKSAGRKKMIRRYDGADTSEYL